MDNNIKEQITTKKIILRILILYTTILFAIVFFRIFDNSFWGDECYSIKLVKMGFLEIIKETGADVHPPLYYIILRLVCSMFGEKGYVFHLVSVVPVGLTLLFCVTTIYKKFGAYASFILASFVFFLDNAIIYSVEVRMYSWANYFVLISFFEIYEIIMKNEKKNWILFSVYSLAAAYTHYYALVAVAFLYVMLIVYEFWKKGHTKKRTIAVCTVAVFFYLPWLFTLLQAFERTSNSWWLQETPKFRYCIQYLFLTNVSLVSWLYVGIWAISIAILIYNTYIVKKVRFEFTFWILSGVVSVIGTICFGEIISIIWRPMFQIKYVYVVAGIAWLMFGILIGRLKGNPIWFIGILILTLIVGIPNYCKRVEKDNECQKGTQLILENTIDMNGGDILLTNADHLDWTILEYYYPQNESILARGNLTEMDLSSVDWVFWTEEVEEMKEQKVAEGYMGPYDYVYVYKVREQ